MKPGRLSPLDTLRKWLSRPKSGNGRGYFQLQLIGGSEERHKISQNKFGALLASQNNTSGQVLVERWLPLSWSPKSFPIRKV